MMATHANALEDVRSFLAEEFGGKTGEVDVTLVPVRAEGQYNMLFRAHLPGMRCPLAVKICTSGSVAKRNGAAARRQFDQLSLVYSETRKRGFRVVEPICFSDERGIVVTTWVEGPTLRGAMADHRASVDDWTQDCERAGAWLKAFHSVKETGDAPLRTGAILDSLNRMQTDGGLDSGVSPLATRSFAVLERTASIVEDTPIAQRFVHSDFHPGNLIKQSEELIGLDIEYARVDHYLHDFVTWMNYIDYMTMLPRGFKMRRHLARLNAAFMRGYRGSDSHKDGRVLLWLRTAAMMSFYQRYQRTGRNWLHDVYFRLAAGHSLRTLCKALSDSDISSDEHVGDQERMRSV